MLKLHTFPGRWGLESLSPFCMKVEVYLELTKIPYERVLGDPRSAPKQKLPYVVHDDGTTIADSTAIIDDLERRHGEPLDGGLDARDRARAHMIRRTFEEGLYFVGLWSRWAEDVGWELSRTFFDPIPAPIRWLVAPMVRKKVIGTTIAQGTGRHSREEIYAMGKRDLVAFSTLLGDSPFVLGERLTTVDVTAYAFLANQIRAEVALPLKDACAELPNLGRYVDRVQKRVEDAKGERSASSLSPFRQPRGAEGARGKGVEGSTEGERRTDLS